MVYLRKNYRLAFWRRARWWACALGVCLLVFSLTAHGTAELSWYQRPMFAAVSGVGASATSLRRWVTSRWPWASDADYAELQRQVTTLTAALMVAEEWRAENIRLRAAVDMPRDTQQPLRGARVVRQVLDDPYRIVVINRGHADGVARGMIVLADGGLAGRVERVAAHHATVLLLTDPNFAVDVVTQRTRARGILQGRGVVTTFGRLLGVSRMEYLLGRSDIRKGDAVVTSGLDGRYPPGLPVGHVHKVSRTRGGFVRGAAVVPLVDWSRIESVVLLPAPPLPASLVGETP